MGLDWHISKTSGGESIYPDKDTHFNAVGTYQPYIDGTQLFWLKDLAYINYDANGMRRLASHIVSQLSNDIQYCRGFLPDNAEQRLLTAAWLLYWGNANSSGNISFNAVPDYHLVASY